MEWHIEKRKLSDICPLDNNPRKISKKNRERLKKDLEIGKFKPFVCDIDGTILGGNQMYSIMAEDHDGNFVVDVSVPERKLGREERQRVVILDNQHRGEDNIDVLQREYRDIIEELGYEDLLPEEVAEVEEDDYVEPADIPIRVRAGEIWQLGNHRLMCSDSTKIEDVEKLMNGEKADMVFTDPPYGVNYAKKNEFLNTISPANRIQKDIENDTMSLDETSDFICQCFVNLRLSLAEKSSYYITAPQGGDLLLMMMKTMQKADIPLRHMLIWVKNNHVLRRTDYNYKHEPILFGWVNTHNFYGKGEFKFSTWEIDKPLKNDLHPTMKPVALIVNACLNSTLEGDKVLDLFGGSGSTLIACEQTNRKCYIMELDERYATIILDRWEKLTGKKGEKTNGE